MSIADRTPTSADNDADVTPQTVHRLEIARKLAAALMLGQMQGRQDDVAPIFGALSRLAQDERPLRLGLAFASALSGDAAPARALLAEGVTDWPQGARALLTIAMSLKAAGDPGWRALAETVSSDADAVASRQARRLLQRPAALFRPMPQCTDAQVAEPAVAAWEGG
jgi:thioredoxin-like negative regulator of GroEL